MSFFTSTFGKSAKGSAPITPTTNVIRKEVRTVPAKPSVSSAKAPKRPASGTTTAAASSGPSGVTRKLQSQNAPASSRSLKNKSAIASVNSSRSLLASSAPKQPKSRSATIRKDNKRKSESPAYRATFGSESEGEHDVDFESYTSSARKRVRVNVSDGLTGDESFNNRLLKQARQIRDRKNWTDEQTTSFELEQSINLTSGAHTNAYKPAFAPASGGADEGSVLSTAAKATLNDNTWAPGKSDTNEEILLHYPNSTRPEHFQLVDPRASDGYRPLDDIYKTILTTLTHYFPDATSKPLLHNVSGIPARLERALRTSSLSAFVTAVDEYNTLIKSTRRSGVMAEHLDSLPYLDEEVVERILEQIYERTVSPQVDLLRKYAMGSDNVYGEIKPAFASQIFRDTSLTSSSIFVDLGSGVGNVVLQAALEIGCEAHGVEIMSNPSTLAAAQALEFPRRCRAWGVAPGSVSLRQADFLDDEETAAVLRKADVILVNNKAFTAETDTRLTQLFLDVKEGARIVSLKSFVRSDFKLSERTAGSVVGMLHVQKRDFWTDYVSWTHEGGEYFVATKDSSRLERF